VREVEGNKQKILGERCLLKVRVVTRMREVVGLCGNQIISVIVYLLKTLNT
jgi:hypothetical protein